MRIILLALSSSLVLGLSGCESSTDDDTDDEAVEDRFDIVMTDKPTASPQSGAATMNCHTGSCTCSNLTYSTCVRACDILWDENCSKAQK
jgi:hypothetical protein